ncbi:MAG TPA: tetratricopeptide repeat protein [Candidatus Omnitrophota bacterium]|nr:tetratricopeptide repeat protein [Candidatus Omnitrophota bacterium]HPT07800.1 tetratricopeptide repeat protein [Candidatus Omnitrophota bacterium]
MTTNPNSVMESIQRIKGTRIGKMVLTVAALFLVFACLSAYFVFRNYLLSTNIKKQRIEIEKISKEGVDLKNNYDKIQNEYAQLKKEVEQAKTDRENLNTQVKGLLSDRDKARQLESEVDSLKKAKGLVDTSLSTAENEKSLVAKQNQNLKEEIIDLQKIQKQVIQEKEDLQQLLVKERDKSGRKKLEDENNSLKKELSRSSVNLQASEAQVKQLKESDARLQEELKNLSSKVEGYNKNMSQAASKNRAFEERLTTVPTKFAEIARQNKTLVKQTATMHYNLGVFYTKQKEYSRALSEFERCLELTPDDAYAHFNIGYIYAEYMVNRQKAINHFRQYLQYCKKDDKDADWVKKYIITWQTWDVKQPLE